MTTPATTPQLRMLFWESTARCNLSCKHCRRISDGASGGELSTGQAKDFFTAAAKMGSPILVFSGGEPLLRSDWQELAEFAREISLPTAMATNATLIDDSLAKQIANCRFRRVSISLDGADAASHDAFRGQAGAFELAVAGARRLVSAGVPIQINASIASHNFRDLDRLAALAKSLGAAALHLFLLVPVGCGLQIAATHQLSAGQYEGVLNWACDRIAGGGLEIRVTCAPHFNRIAAGRGLAVRGAGCLCGQSVIFVSHDGEVFPCGYLPVSCGSVLRQGLEEIWRNSPVLAKLRDRSLRTGKCGRCDFRDVCGGCRARALGMTGDYLAAEPACEYTAKEAPL